MMMEDGSQWMMLLRALGGLALVLALIFVLAHFAKRFFQSEKWSTSLAGIKILHSLPIGSKKKLMLIEVEGRRILIGVGSESVHGICELGEVSKPSDSKEMIYGETNA